MKLKITMILFAITLLIANSNVAFATNEVLNGDLHITGDVVDSENGDHISFATIVVDGTTIGTVADATGHFMITSLAKGKYSITASSIGYASQTKEVVVGSDGSIDLRFELEPERISINEVVVTGSRTETLRRESPVIVNVASAELFEKTSSNSVAEVLNFQPGLRVEYNCSNCGISQLRINGLNGEYSQILIDSRAVFSSLAGVYGLEQLPPSMIEKVEVIRGGGSALFGANAIGGVVNIITKDPKRNSALISNTTSVNENGGFDINTSLNASLVSDDSRTGLYIFSMLRNRDSYDRNGDSFSEVPTLDSQTLGFRAFHRLSQRSRISAEYHHIREQRRGGNKLDLKPHEADLAEQLIHSINSGGLKYDYYSNNLKHRLQLYTSLQSIKRDSYFGVEQDLNAYGNTEDLTIVGGAQYIYDMNKFLFMPAQLTMGVEYNGNALDDEMEGYNRNIEQTTYTYGTFFQNEWKNEKFSLLVGGRLDKNSMIDKVIFSPRANARYSPSDFIGIRASYSSGYRAPQVYDEDLHVSAVGGEISLIELSKGLRPEYSNSFSGSVDLYRKFGEVELNLLLEGFYTNLDDVFALKEKGYNSDGNMIYERINASGAIVKGINVEAKAGLTRNLILEAAYTYQKSRYKEDFEWSPDVVPQKSMYRTPDKYGYASLNYQISRSFSSTFTANYTGKMLVQHCGAEGLRSDVDVITPTFWDAAVRLAYDFRLSPQMNLQINGGVKNLFDSYQKDIENGLVRDAGYIYGPITPRTFYLGAKFTM